MAQPRYPFGRLMLPRITINALSNPQISWNLETHRVETLPDTHCVDEMDIVKYTKEELLYRCVNLGPKGLRIIQEELAKLGLELKGKYHKPPKRLKPEETEKGAILKLEADVARLKWKAYRLEYLLEAKTDAREA